MEMQIKPVGDHCAESGAKLTEGDSVVSYLYISGEGSLERRDILLGREAGVQIPGTVVCKWQRRIRGGAGAAAAAERKTALAAAEALFVGLCENAEGMAALEHAEELKFLLGLQLERKRVLRRLGAGRYLHVREKVEYAVPQIDVTPEVLLRLRAALEALDF